MPNDSTGSSEISRLIYNVHLDIPKIEYSCNGTGVDMDEVKHVFDSFGYQKVSKGNYLYYLVTEDLDQGQPVILSGGTKGHHWIFPVYTDGHAWVCDGYKESLPPFLSSSKIYFMLHMNWGWGGIDNGWYKYNDFSPYSHSYNYKVKMIYNIKPETK